MPATSPGKLASDIADRLPENCSCQISMIAFFSNLVSDFVSCVRVPAVGVDVLIRSQKMYNTGFAGLMSPPRDSTIGPISSSGFIGKTAKNSTDRVYPQIFDLRPGKSWGRFFFWENQYLVRQLQIPLFSQVSKIRESQAGTCNRHSSSWSIRSFKN